MHLPSGSAPAAFFASLLSLTPLTSLVVGCAAAPSPPVAAPPAPPRSRPIPVVVTPDDVGTERRVRRRGASARSWSSAGRMPSTPTARSWPPTPRPSTPPSTCSTSGSPWKARQARAEARDTFSDVARRFPNGPSARACARPRRDPRRLPRGLARARSHRRHAASRSEISRTSTGSWRSAHAASRGSRWARTAAHRKRHPRRPRARPIGSTTAIATSCPSRSPSCASRSASCAACAPSASASTRCRPTSSTSSRSVAAACLEAQAAYAMAVRSVDPHWAAMAGYRVGEMYRLLHARPDADPTAGHLEDRDDRSRCSSPSCTSATACCSKRACREIDQTLPLGERTGDSSPGSSAPRERQARDEDAPSLTRRRQIAPMPFTEAEVNAALDALKKKAQRLARRPCRGRNRRPHLTPAGRHASRAPPRSRHRHGDVCPELP